MRNVRCSFNCNLNSCKYLPESASTGFVSLLIFCYFTFTDSSHILFPSNQLVFAFFRVNLNF